MAHQRPLSKSVSTCENHRICGHCKIGWPNQYFYIKDLRTGLRDYLCIRCRKAYRSEWGRKNRKTLNAKTNAWRKANRERYLERQRERRKEAAQDPYHVARLKAYGVEYRKRIRDEKPFFNKARNLTINFLQKLKRSGVKLEFRYSDILYSIVKSRIVASEFNKCLREGLKFDIRIECIDLRSPGSLESHIFIVNETIEMKFKRQG